jgi:ferrous-iron efflux pump FieF
MSAINTVAVYKAKRPPDKEYQFGYGKIEALVGLFQSVFIAFSSFYLLKEAAIHFFSPEKLSYHIGASIVMIFSIILTSVLLIFQNHVIKKTKSLAVTADMLHYKTDIIVNIGVIISFFISTSFNFFVLDALMGACIAFYIFFASFEVIKSSTNVLIDKKLSSQFLKEIQKIVLEHNEVLGIHDIKSRSGGYKKFIQFHLELKPSLTLEEAHAISDEVEELILNKFSDSEVLIHLDPFGYDKKNL